jgi:Glycosyl hydrolases family 39
MFHNTLRLKSNSPHVCSRFLGSLLAFAAVLAMGGCGGGSSSAAIAVNFNGRSGGAVIPAGLFGSALGNLANVSEMQTLVSAGMSGTRLYANVPGVFASATPDWTQIDPSLDNIKLAGMKAIFMIAYSPTWLQPATSPCVAPNPPTHAAPTNNSTYASIAAQYVAHLDQKYPGLVEYYEIWNEPDTSNQFCGLTAGDSTQQRLNEYTALYRASAIAMKQQSAIDGASIKVGGPSLSNYLLSSAWVTQLLTVTNNGSPLVDFVSVHEYPSGSDVSHTMTWDGTGGTASLYARTIDPNSGFAAVYLSLAKSLASAGSAVPILMDEYNDDWDFYNDCCKNSPTYSPVWNTMVFSLLMNTVYNGAQPVQRLNYYAADNQPFCLLGYTGDTTYDCGTTGPQNPYPQFRAYELLASPNFLGLQAKGGNLAISVANSSALKSAGLHVSAFYTSDLDAVVLVNPLGTAMSNVSLELENHGLNNPIATQYLLNSSTYSPTTEVSGTALALTTNGTSVQATVTIPPYSVLDIKVTGQ